MKTLVEKRQFLITMVKPSMMRQRLIKKISHHIAKIERPHPVRVAIDGVDCAGKTMFAAELGQELHKQNRPIIHASIDGFHRTREERYRRGKLSPKGYFCDSFDLDALTQNLLKPLGLHGDLIYTNAVFDFRTDSPVPKITHKTPPDAILLFDGVFLLRPEIDAHWDFRIFLQVSFQTVLERALLRDAKLFGSAQETEQRYLKRYIPGQKIYMKEVHPRQKADIVIDNNNPANPIILKGAGMHF
jgi:uridine kinase